MTVQYDFDRNLVRNRFETFCYGPLGCKYYKRGPARAVSYKGMTGAGQEIAETFYERHRILTQFFVSLGVEEHIAETDACKVEHDLSPETFEAIRKHITGS